MEKNPCQSDLSVTDKIYEDAYKISSAFANLEDLIMNFTEFQEVKLYHKFFIMSYLLYFLSDLNHLVQ